MRAKPSTKTIPWRQDHLEYFDLALPTWQAPAEITSTTNARRTRITVRATFTRPDGVPVALTSRMRKDAEGTWWGVGETLRIRMTFKPGSASEDIV